MYLLIHLSKPIQYQCTKLFNPQRLEVGFFPHVSGLSCTQNKMSLNPGVIVAHGIIDAVNTIDNRTQLVQHFEN